MPELASDIRFKWIVDMSKVKFTPPHIEVTYSPSKDRK